MTKSYLKYRQFPPKRIFLIDTVNPPKWLTEALKGLTEEQKDDFWSEAITQNGRYVIFNHPEG